MYDLSILIPARNEVFLRNTVEDIQKNIRGNTEIIIVLDGEWADPGIEQADNVTIIYHPRSVGQRAATNEACKLSKAKYVMKADAHVAFDEGFDVKMMNLMEDDITMVPVMKNLHVFDWVCPEGHRRYQSGINICPTCDKECEQEIIWQPKKSPNSTSFCFDQTLHFQYFNSFKKRPEGQGDLTETMSIQGSCFMLTRKKYWELNICDEAFGSWGQQGVEVACKTWFSGGRVVCNQTTWYAHYFRTGTLSFPYPNPESEIEKARQRSRDMFLHGTWPGSMPGRNVEWLLKKFYPVEYWHDEKGIIYYTDSRLDEKMNHAVQTQILRSGVPTSRIVSSSLKPMNFGGKNIHFDLERGQLTMFKQILAALEASTSPVIFFCEHDVLYHPSHFDFMPLRKDTFYYNENVWKIDPVSGKAIHYPCRQTSGLVAYRDLLIKHYKERVRRVEEEGFSMRMGYEPGTHNRPERVDDYKSEAYFSKLPNVDIRHDKNLTKTRWSKDEFRNPKYTEGWTEADEVPGWGRPEDILLSYEAK